MVIQAADPPLVLASASPARRAVLAGSALSFDVVPAAVDEAAVKESVRAEGGSAGDAALTLARLKAERVALRRPDAMIIGADQILVCGGTWFDKPPDLASARTQLCALRGRSHELATAIVCVRGGREVWRHLAAPRLMMRAFSDDFLDAYLTLEADAVTSSVGAYRLEGVGVHLFDAIDGDQTAILGLPLLPLVGFLRQTGILLS